MKKYFFMLSLILSIGLISSCNKDDENADLTPTIDFIATDGAITGNTTVKEGTVITFNTLLKSNAESESKLTSFTIQPIRDNKQLNPVVKDLNDKVTTIIETFTMDVVGETNFSFTLMDKKGQTTKKDIKITVDPIVVGVPVKKVSNIKLGSNDSSLGSFFSSTEGKAYKIADAKAKADKIDFCFFYGATKKYAIASIDADYSAAFYNDATNGIATWTKRNKTRFAEASNLTAEIFDAIGETYEFPTLTIEEEGALNLDPSKAPIFYYFQTEAGKKGILKITKLFDPRGDEEIEFDAIIEK